MNLSTFSKETLIAMIDDLQNQIIKYKYAAEVRITKIEETTRYWEHKLVDTKEISTQTKNNISNNKDICIQTEDNISNDKDICKIESPYIKLATNNLEKVLADPKGARCVYCFGSPHIKSDINIIDISTIICPDCNIDAVVPASCVPNEETLVKWHQFGFGNSLINKREKTELRFSKEANIMSIYKVYKICCQNIWYMNGNVKDLETWNMHIKNNYVWTWSDNGKNDSIEKKINTNNIIAWHIVSKGFNSILRVSDKPHKITDEELKLSMTDEQVIEKKEGMKKHNYTIIFIPVEFLATTTTNFVKKETISSKYNKEWSGGLRGSHCIKPNNDHWLEQVFEMYNYLKNL